MRIGFISPKAGQGTTIVACATAVALAKNGEATIVPSVDTWAALGLSEGATTATMVDLNIDPTPSSDTPNVVLDGERGDVTYLVVRACYLALRRAVHDGITADGIVLIEEPGRALQARDVAFALNIPIVAKIPFDPNISRCVDAGLLAARTPAVLEAGVRAIIEHATSLATA